MSRASPDSHELSLVFAEEPAVQTSSPGPSSNLPSASLPPTTEHQCSKSLRPSFSCHAEQATTSAVVTQILRQRVGPKTFSVAQHTKKDAEPMKRLRHDFVRRNAGQNREHTVAGAPKLSDATCVDDVTLALQCIQNGAFKGDGEIDLSSAVLISVPDFVVISYALSHASPIKKISISGRSIPTPCMRLLLDAVRSNPTPITEVDFVTLPDAADVEWNTLRSSIVGQCRQNAAFASKESTFPPTGLQRQLTRVRSMRLVFPAADALQKREMTDRAQLRRKEWRERQQLRAALRTMRVLSASHELAKKRSEQLAHLCSTISMEELSRRIALCQWFQRDTFRRAGLIADSFAASIFAEEERIRKHIWTEYCLDWYVANRGLSLRHLIVQNEREQVFKDCVTKRFDIVRIFWDERLELHNAYVDGIVVYRRTLEKRRLESGTNDEERRKRLSIISMSPMKSPRGSVNGRAESPSKSRRKTKDNLEASHRCQTMATQLWGLNLRQENGRNAIRTTEGGSELVMRNCLRELSREFEAVAHVKQRIRLLVDGYLNCAMELPTIQLIAVKDSPLATTRSYAIAPTESTKGCSWYDGTHALTDSDAERHTSTAVDPYALLRVSMGDSWKPRTFASFKAMNRMVPALAQSCSTHIQAAKQLAGKAQQYMNLNSSCTPQFEWVAECMEDIQKNVTSSVTDQLLQFSGDSHAIYPLAAWQSRKEQHFAFTMQLSVEDPIDADCIFCDNFSEQPGVRINQETNTLLTVHFAAEAPLSTEVIEKFLRKMHYRMVKRPQRMSAKPRVVRIRVRTSAEVWNVTSPLMQDEELSKCPMQTVRGEGTLFVVVLPPVAYLSREPNAARPEYDCRSEHPFPFCADAHLRDFSAISRTDAVKGLAPSVTPSFPSAATIDVFISEGISAQDELLLLPTSDIQKDPLGVITKKKKEIATLYKESLSKVSFVVNCAATVDELEEMMQCMVFCNTSPAAEPGCRVIRIRNNHSPQSVLNLCVDVKAPEILTSWIFPRHFHIYRGLIAAATSEELIHLNEGWIAPVPLALCKNCQIVDPDTENFCGGYFKASIEFGLQDSDTLFIGIDPLSSSSMSGSAGVRINSTEHPTALLLDGTVIGSVEETFEQDCRTSISVKFVETGEASMDAVRTLVHSLQYQCSSSCQPGTVKIMLELSIGPTANRTDVYGEPVPLCTIRSATLKQEIVVEKRAAFLELPPYDVSLKYIENSGPQPVFQELKDLPQFDDFSDSYLRVEIHRDDYEGPDEYLTLDCDPAKARLLLRPMSTDQVEDLLPTAKHLKSQLGSSNFTDSFVFPSRRRSLRRMPSIVQNGRKMSRLMSIRRDTLGKQGLDGDFLRAGTEATEILYTDAEDVIVGRLYRNPQRSCIVVSFALCDPNPQQLMAIFRAVKYCNTNRNPIILERRLRVTFSVPHQGTSCLLRKIEIQPVDDPTEVTLERPSLRFRFRTSECEPLSKQQLKQVVRARDRANVLKTFPESSFVSEDQGRCFERIGVLAIFHPNFTRVFDPDTDYWDGGSVEIVAVGGGIPCGCLKFMTVEQQGLLNRFASSGTTKYVLHTDEVSGQVVLVCRSEDEDVPNESVGIGTVKYATNTSQATSDTNVFSLQLDAREYESRRVTVECLSYLLCSICFVPDERAHFATQRTRREFRLFIRDCENPVVGECHFDIDFLPPVLSVLSPAPSVFSTRSNSGGELLCAGLQCNLGDKEKLSGYLEIVPLSGVQPKDTIFPKFQGTQFALTADGHIIAGRDGIVGRYIQLSNYIRLDFGVPTVKGANGKRITQFLKCMYFKTDHDKDFPAVLGDRIFGIVISDGFKDNFGRLEASITEVTANVTDAVQKEK